MLVRLSFLALTAFVCACVGPTGMAGSYKRMCYDEGVQPSSREMYDCINRKNDEAQARFDASGRGQVTAAIIGAAVAGAVGNGKAPNSPPVGGVMSGQLKSQYVSGSNRICIYSTMRGDVAQTVGFAEMCPLSPR
jgi:hypothetical protein